MDIKEIFIDRFCTTFKVSAANHENLKEIAPDVVTKLLGPYFYSVTKEESPIPFEGEQSWVFHAAQPLDKEAQMHLESGISQFLDSISTDFDLPLDRFDVEENIHTYNFDFSARLFVTYSRTIPPVIQSVDVILSGGD